MNNNEPAAEHYSINGFKYFSELAKNIFQIWQTPLPPAKKCANASKQTRR